jgi:hypothetical protein
MQIVAGQEQEYREWKAKQGDPYGERIFSYAEDWADLMEKQQHKGGVDGRIE